MPSGIMSLMNNTSKKISYHNKESGHKFEVNPQTVDWGVDGQYNFGAHNIEIWIGEKIRFFLCEYQAHFYYVYDTDGTQTGKKIAPPANGGQYILRFDPVDTLYDHAEPSLTIYHYKDTVKSLTGLIYNIIITELSTHAVNILLSIGPIA
ncbi:hypothetical protein BBAD15_g9018 [Beauveria bassiana D1-5]|uniref:Uncharacterized protein n=1 Tax=Beauveria bassiana D1-5 TaxID=1245745 RepID=A0A0A2VCW0_BEABA|nr:hypothetical protein BBAD15_g9018 [Beauveria bassiana D1-5]